MPLHIPPVTLSISSYEVEGTSGQCYVPEHVHPHVFEVMPEMTKTVTLRAGDKVMLSFQANLCIKYRSTVEYAIRANGEVIGFIPSYGGGGSTSWSVMYSIWNISTNRIYTAVADGDVVFDVVWRLTWASGPAHDITYVVENDRKLTLMVMG